MNDRNREYWENGADYEEYVRNELKDSRKLKWTERIKSNLPLKSLKILDAGCGPGFFSCILSEEGHDVTGIDRSEDMLKYARENAEELKVSPEFLCMDINNLNFSDNTFDAIISRNVTWTLDDPETIYKEFYRKLKHGGVLIIYDANWHIPFYCPDMLERVKENEKWYYETFGKEFKVYDDDTSIFENLPLSNTVRPEWDVDALKKAGFHDVRIDRNAGEYLYSDWELKLYSETPLFEICAVK